MDNQIKVSIIIPYHIDRGFLSTAVRSCENQRGFKLNEDYEIIVQQGFCPLGENINAGLEKARGKYYKVCPEDDILTPNCLIDLWEFAESGDYDLVCADAMNFQPDGETYIVKSEIPAKVKHLAMKNTIHGGTILYKLNGIRWDQSLIAAEEYELSLRMAADGCKFGYIPETVFEYRIGEQQKSGIYWIKDEDSQLYRFEIVEQIQNAYLDNDNLINR